LQHLLEEHAERVREALTAEFRIARERRPAASGDRLVGILEPCRRAYRAVVETAALDVADTIRGEYDVLAELGALLENRVDEIRARLLAAGELGEMPLGVGAL
jgi:hypothetical protein